MKVVKKEKQIFDVTIESYTLCDKCNKKIETRIHDSFECVFNHQTGTGYPECGSGALQKMELCQKCAVEAVALLRENGYRVIDY